MKVELNSIISKSSDVFFFFICRHVDGGNRFHSIYKDTGGNYEIPGDVFRCPISIAFSHEYE